WLRDVRQADRRRAKASAIWRLHEALYRPRSASSVPRRLRGDRAGAEGAYPDDPRAAGGGAGDDRAALQPRSGGSGSGGGSGTGTRSGGSSRARKGTSGRSGGEGARREV